MRKFQINCKLQVMWPIVVDLAQLVYYSHVTTLVNMAYGMCELLETESLTAWLSCTHVFYYRSLVSQVLSHHIAGLAIWVAFPDLGGHYPSFKWQMSPQTLLIILDLYPSYPLSAQHQLPQTVRPQIQEYVHISGQWWDW